MPNKDPHVWFSFSKGGKNQGICIVKDDHENPGSEQAMPTALRKAIKLGIVPEYDHMRAFEVDGAEGDLEINRLYTPEEMKAREYESTNEKVMKNGN